MRARRRGHAWSGHICLAGLSCAGLAMADNVRHGMGAMLPKLRQPATMPEVSAANIASAPPSSVDLSPWAVEIGDQGVVNSCVAWTVAHDLAGWYANSNGESVNLFAPMYLYSQINGGVDKGSNPMDAFRLSVEQGIDTEEDYADGLLIQNHWGTEWGSEGYGILAWSVVEHDVNQAIVATVNH
ncbi:hypothetical protein KFS84_15515 [Xanthomonas translucens pv. graminis]|nr:hypothetical protein A6R72_13620 [Xanthomonas translucens pv. graminis]UKE53666.1 hypothetical protein KFS84_15515 [Xanthomonas translucens pv. graminis]WIH07980.1 hypothetical protein KM579_16065 [Xanthomonas translucens pv. graminis]WIH13262.1 hypothetical protein KM563_05945 [Xanthomonas translucens pv. graminis]WIH16861.1 hypothetical protein KM433_05560 [Xanthomonas translucens pv. graminis]